MDKATMIALMVPGLLNSFRANDPKQVEKAIDYAEEIWQKVLEKNP